MLTDTERTASKREPTREKIKNKEEGRRRAALKRILHRQERGERRSK
jgi:hypothetical protein